MNDETSTPSAFVAMMTPTDTVVHPNGSVTLSRQDVSYALTGIGAVIAARKWNPLELRALNELKAVIAGVTS